jgi:hypothetical protein
MLALAAVSAFTLIRAPKAAVGENTLLAPAA